MATTDSTTKRCTKCGAVYPATKEYFNKDSRTKLGLKPDCRRCHSIANKLWHSVNPAARKADAKRWREANPDYNKEYRDKHPDKFNEASYRYYKNHPDKVRESNKRWQVANPDKVRARTQRREARELSLPATLTDQEWGWALEHFHGCCVYCGKPPSLFDHNQILHQDHFKPLSKGGGYTADNIIPACQSCNLSKGDKNPQEWITRRFGKRSGKRILNRIQEYFASL